MWHSIFLALAVAALAVAAIPVDAQQRTRPCMTCNGTGDWINPRTGNIGTCPACRGTGVETIKPPPPKPPKPPRDKGW
jgi:hypothetical protein